MECRHLCGVLTGEAAILAALQPPADHHRISQSQPGRDGVPPPSAPQLPVVARGACLPLTDYPRHIPLAHRIDDPPDILQRILRPQRDADHALCLTYRKPNRLQYLRHQRRRRDMVGINTADQDITSQCPRVPPIRLIFPSSFNWLNIRSIER